MPFGPSVRTTQPGLVKPIIYPTWARNYNTRGTYSTTDENCPSRYEQFVTAMTSDERFQREVTLGKRIGFYKFRGELGTGNFSRVKLGFHQLAHERVAVKIIEKSGMDQKALKMLSREISNLDTVRHPAIVRLFEVLETISNVYLVMEVAPLGEMFTHVSNEGKYDEAVAKRLYSQIVSAVEFMHSRDLYHRDIKAENVFLSAADRALLGDFGFSTQLVNQAEHENRMLTTFCGSPPYAAPELFKDDAYSGSAVDIWALGVLLYFMVTATLPFTAQTVAGLKQTILENNYYVPEYLSKSCVDLLRMILTSEPSDRSTLQGIRNSEWLQGEPLLETLPDYYFVPSLPEERTPMETTVAAKLEELGITETMLGENRDKGGRSAVIGTYRILMHRANCEVNEPKGGQGVLNVPSVQSNQGAPTSTSSSPLPQATCSSHLGSAVPTPQPSPQRKSPTPVPQVASSTTCTTAPVCSTSPTKQGSKLKHKFNFTILPTKSSNQASAKKKGRGSSACVIL